MTHPYAEIALDHCPASARAWLERALAASDASEPGVALLPAFAGARRRLGEAPVAPTLEQLHRLEAAGLEPPIGWPCADLGRAALLSVALAALPSHAHAELANTLYTRGDNAERRAVLRALPILPEPARFLETAIDACRTHVVPVFEAIACENPYPERHFPDLAYNQLVLKALFLEVPLARVRGLLTRARPELARMALDYAAERRAAGRPIPADIARIPGCAPSEAGSPLR